MNYQVYVLHSTTYSKIYIGYTSNLNQRIKSHNFLAKKGYTVKYRPWSLIYHESFEEKKQAIKRERALKTARGRKFIWDLIKSNN
ncbi:MAG: GIY-YIG nuclease family protein [Chitinophagales bacterium]|nr:GIY-YIG nuclease family protein [Chitinophagales bacterium]